MRLISRSKSLIGFIRIGAVHLPVGAVASMRILFFWKIEPLLKERGLWVAQGWMEAFLFAVCVARR